jgi:diguanylate cyclase (GGDEF)-like protein
VASWGNLPACESIFDALQCQVLQSDDTNRMEDFPCSLTCQQIPLLDTYRSICVPLIIHSEKVGILRLCGSSHTSAQTYDTMRRLARIVAEHLVLALTNLHMRERLRDLAIRDALTGLFNRRYLDETLVRELRRARRYQHSVGVIMLDIDHFKQFNDTYGHDAGDTLLREMAAFLQKQVRSDDIACRYGGEEFILILPGASLVDTERRAEEVRLGVKRLEVKHNGQWLGRITISLGVAVFPDHGETDEEVIKAADKALFRAKRCGRDQVMTGWRKGMTGTMEVVQG